jgi:hypothetical protein
MSTSTELAPTPAEANQLRELETVARDCRTQLANVEEQFGSAFALAKLTKKLDSLISPEMMSDVMALRGHALGFRTDKDDKPDGYPVEVVRPAFIEATVRGFRPVNNEFNIIAGRFYGCKAGFMRLVRTYPGLTNFQDSLGIPDRQGGRAFVAYVASWLLDGEEMSCHRGKKRLAGGGEFDDRIVVRVNEKMGDDAILGKATRKAYAGIYDLITGHTVPTPEGDVADAIDVPSRKPVRKSRLFDDTPPEPTGPNVAEQDAVIKEYEKRLGNASAVRFIGPIAKDAGADMRLITESRKEVAGLCTKRRKELSEATA